MKGAIVMMYDAPEESAFNDWMHGPHYDEVMATPGVTAVERYTVADPDQRRFVAIIRTDDLDATLKWRDGEAGQKSQKEANDRGVHNRFGLSCQLIYSSADHDLEHIR